MAILSSKSALLVFLFLAIVKEYETVESWRETFDHNIMHKPNPVVEANCDCNLYKKELKERQKLLQDMYEVLQGNQEVVHGIHEVLQGNQEVLQGIHEVLQITTPDVITCTPPETIPQTIPPLPPILPPPPPPAEPILPPPPLPLPPLPAETTTDKCVKVSDCRTALTNSPTAFDGVYEVYAGGAIVQAFCVMQANGGGWTVIQRRSGNATDFKQTWNKYADGFGNVNNESIWLGNKLIHNMTACRSCVLRVEMQHWDSNIAVATYQNFSIDGEDEKFRLHVGNYSGTGGDSLAYADNTKFSTYDQDNDALSHGACAEIHGGGGWWYKNCGTSCLNGRYHKGHYTAAEPDGVVWNTTTGKWYSLEATVMMFRCSN